VNAQKIDDLPLFSTQPPDSFKNRQVSFARPVLFQALASNDPYVPIRSDASHKRVDESGLADAGFSCDKYDLTFSSKHLVHPASHPRQWCVSPDNSLRKICGKRRGVLPIGCRRRPGLCDLTDEAIASTMCGFNETWSCRVIVERLADLTYSDFQDRFADKGAWPDSIEKFLFGDKLARTPEEMVEHCEGLRSEFYCLRTFQQALVGQIQAKGIEDDTFFVRHSSHRR
jgi:hypothetical protein